MALIELAKKAEEAFLVEEYPGRIHHVSWDYIPRGNTFGKVTETVIYVGCGRELSSIFLFDNANRFIHQDLRFPMVRSGLRILENEKIVNSVQDICSEDVRMETSFHFNNTDKKIIEVQMDVEKCAPSEIRENLGAIYFFGMPYGEAIRGIQVNVMPYLRVGGIFEGAYPYSGGKFEGGTPEQLGLEWNGETYIKVRQLEGNEIRKIQLRNMGSDTKFL